MSVQAPVMIMAGGTGGHIFPGLAVADELRARGIATVWLGGKAGMETRLVPPHEIPLETIEISGVRGKGLRTLLGLPFTLTRAVLAARRVLRRHRPRSVLSLGGYAAAPGGIAARMAKIPLIVHEQNRIAGKTNRLLARFATRVLSGFDGVFANAQWIGNPVRANIAAIAAPGQRFVGRSGALRVLVLGGSQGAQSLNAAVPEMLKSSPVSVQVRHQSGEKHLDAARAAYAQAGVAADVVPFERDMAGAYAWADVVICRAGALTLAELAAAGVASILVPFPHAVDDHQTRNAQAMVAAGGASLVSEGADFAARLGAAFAPMCERATLLRMAQAAHTQARPDATRRIADACLEVAA